MIGNLVRRFKKHRIVLRKIYKDLCKAFHNIDNDEVNGRFLKASGIEFQVPKETEQLCNDITENEISLVIFGQNNYAKAVVVNELMQLELLPIKETSITSWRLIRVRNGTKNVASLCTSGSLTHFDDSSLSYIEEIIQDGISEGDPSRTSDPKEVIVDITVRDNSLLTEGLQLIVSPTCGKQTVDDLAEVYSKTLHGVYPILLYVIQSGHLNSWNLIELTELRRLVQDQPVLFIIVPPKESYCFRSPSRTLPSSPTNLLYKKSTSSQAKNRPHLKHKKIIGKSYHPNKSKLDPIDHTVLHQEQQNPDEQISTIDKRSSTETTDKMFSVHHESHRISNTIDSTELDNNNQESSCRYDSNTPNMNEFPNKIVSVLSHIGFLPPLYGEPKYGVTNDRVGHVTPQSNESYLTVNDLKANACDHHTIVNKKEVKMLHSTTEGTIRMNRPDVCYSELVFICKRNFEGQFESFMRRRLRSSLLSALCEVNDLVSKCLQGLVLQAYDLAHDRLVTPKRLEYVKKQEAEIYVRLLDTIKQEHSRIIYDISDVLRHMRDVFPNVVAQDLDFIHIESNQSPPCITKSSSPSCLSGFYPFIKSSRTILDVYQNTGHKHLLPSRSCEPLVIGKVDKHPATDPLHSSTPAEIIKTVDIVDTGLSSRSSESTPTYREYKAAVTAIKDYITFKLNDIIAAHIFQCLEILHHSCIGTLERTLANLECLKDDELNQNHSLSCPSLDQCGGEDTDCDSLGQLECPKVFTPIGKSNDEWENYFHSLLNNPNSINESVSTCSTHGLYSHLPVKNDETSINSATLALRSLLKFSYGLNIPIRITPSAHILGLLEKVKELFTHSLPRQPPPKLDYEWTANTAGFILNSLDEKVIAKAITSQIVAKIRDSHEKFISAIGELELRTEIRNCRFEEAQEKIRQQHAPRLARIALDTLSLRNFLLHGLPTLTREIGRGQYGVVYACSFWGHYSNLAVKSVVPPDEKHWRDLALEIYYSMHIPRHDRIVSLYACVIDYDHGFGSTPAVLLMMERLVRDLHVAIKQGLSWLSRLSVARDVVEGMRYLHGQGLVHRDIKPRNVLLDSNDRAKLTDLGFCKPQAMIGGSILGVRPERLNCFTQECWELMQQCWNRSARNRPHPGQIAEQLDKIYQSALEESSNPIENRSNSESRSES